METGGHFDVLIIGAGLSGIDAAYRLQTMSPGQTYAILEGRAAIGGTWDLFRYPGIRSDSDIFTLGYPFKPWQGKNAIADGESIRNYIVETAAEYGIDRHIQFQHHVERASWSSAEARWTVEATVGPDATPVQYTCRFLSLCSGYYSYEAGYQPEFPGRDRFTGPVIHPQAWPEDLDYAGKRIVVIGSGATAVTLIPSMAPTAGHITMLQRSPTYITSLPARDVVADALRKVLPAKVAHHVIRAKWLAVSQSFYQLCRRWPEVGKRIIRNMNKMQLPKDYPVDPDFAPRYNPWQQRLCVVPDGDLFRAIRKGQADIVTDEIESFTETGILLKSGRELEADLIVSATGLQLVACGGIAFSIDGVPVDLSERFIYKGFMLNDMPNLSVCLGYTNASWTLRADIIAKEVAKLINRIDAGGYDAATPHLNGPIEAESEFDLTSGYFQRSRDQLPKQGTKSPWRLRQNYVLDLATSRFGDVTECLELTKAQPKPSASVAGGPAAP